MDGNGSDQRRMIELLDDLNSQEGARESLVEGVILLRMSQSSPPVPALYEPCIVIVAQGRKRFHLPNRVVTYDPRNYLVLTVPAPADCETEIGEHGPFLGLAVRIDLAMLSDLLMKMEAATCPVPPTRNQEWVSAPVMTGLLSRTTVRLLESLGSKTEAKVLGPQLVRELIYRVLCGESGGTLQDLLLTNGARARIHRVLYRMHTSYAAPIDIPSLAHSAGMSVSAFHSHFKAVSATSPLQYLKTIRLHKAKVLMVQQSLSASSAAERVGYDSPSQFSREFKRLFGAPPSDEAQRVRLSLGD